MGNRTPFIPRPSQPKARGVLADEDRVRAFDATTAMEVNRLTHGSRSRSTVVVDRRPDLHRFFEEKIEVRRRPYPNASSQGLRGRAHTICHRAVQQVTVRRCVSVAVQGSIHYSVIKLEVHGRARREAARRRKSECKVNLLRRNSSRSNGSCRMSPKSTKYSAAAIGRRSDQ